MNKTTFHGEISIFTYFHYEITIFFNVKPLNAHFIPLFVSGDPHDPLRQAKTQGHRPGAVRNGSNGSHEDRSTRDRNMEVLHGFTISYRPPCNFLYKIATVKLGNMQRFRAMSLNSRGDVLQIIYGWLVVWNMTFIFPYIGNNPSH